MKVENLNGYKNQFLITDDEGNKTYQSYDSEICMCDCCYLYLKGNKWDYSVTTRRHFKAFINEYTPFTYENKQQWLEEIKSNNNIKVE